MPARSGDFGAAIALVFVATTVAASPPVKTQRTAGLVVESAEKDSAADKAGIKAGDVLVSWVRAPNLPANPSEARGTFASPFDVTEVEIEQSPRGDMTLAGRRDGQPFSVTLPPGDWKIEVRPALSAEGLERYIRAKQRIAEGELASGIALLREQMVGLDRKDPESACWLLKVIGDAWSRAKKWDEARAAYEEAKGRARQPSLLAAIATAQGITAREQSDLARAEAALREALAHRESVERDSLSVAATLHELGGVSYTRGDLTAAADSFGKALAIREQRAPESLVVADTLVGLGTIANAKGSHDEAERLCQRSLVIRGRLAPASLRFAQSIACLGGVAWARGELAAAEAWWEQTLEIQQRLAPDSRPLSWSLNNLAILRTERGDYAGAEDLFRRSLAIKEALNPGSHEVSVVLNNLGNLAHNRGELGVAQHFYHRSLALTRAIGSEGLDHARALDNLALATAAAGDLVRAQALHTEALAVRERLAPESLQVAISLFTQAGWARERKAWEEAEELARHALAIRERSAPGSLAVAESLHLLGLIAVGRGDLALAEGLHQRALSIHERLAPGSDAEAATLHALGEVFAYRGLRQQAADHLGRAVDVLEQQGSRLGRPAHATPDFAAKQRTYYHDYTQVLIELGQPEEAFHTLERARARTLLTMLAERDLLLAADLPPELEREQRRLGTEYEKAQSALGGLTAEAKPEEAETAIGRLRELGDQREALAERIRQLSPRLAALRYPQPLEVQRVRGALDAGTGLTVLSLPIGETALRQEVENLRSVTQQTDSKPGRGRAALAAGLYDRLLAPADAILRRHQRLLISPDGPLHRLPFAALVRKGKYLAEWRAFHTVASGTLYAGLRASRAPDGPRHWASQLAAFGDPSYPDLSRERSGDIQEPNVRDEVQRGRDLGPLPATRREVEAIAGLFPEGAAEYLGDEASEERAKTVGRGVRYVHFACHGLINERFPLNSALALTIRERPQAGQDNGLLQAWEIMEKVRLDADLVTLSACDSGLGKEVGGEGLVGLTRAFQYAGARSVLASLWSVPDESTAELMKHFYGYLKAGKSKDEALRAAQIAAIRGGGTAAHPLRWAAFQLHGDWR